MFTNIMLMLNAVGYHHNFMPQKKYIYTAV